MPRRVRSTRWRCWTGSAAAAPFSEHPPYLLPPTPLPPHPPPPGAVRGLGPRGLCRSWPPAGETLGKALPEAAGGLRWWDALSLGKACAAPCLVLVENSLGAMMKLQIWCGFGELMVMAWGGGSGQGDFSNAQQTGVQSSLGLLHMAAAGGNEQAGAVGGEA